MKICPVCSTEYPDDVKFCPNDGQTVRAAAPASDLVGQVVADRYHVIRKLGEGGMGQVYLAEHVKMGRRSAIKVMNPAMVHDPDAVARFNREAANASRITHPNVCAIYDFGETPDGLIYLAMEFIEGEPLTDLVEREGALPVTRAVSIFLQVADALQAAHDLGIVHRDLKPDNIMLTRRKGGDEGVKVVDFGIAKAVGGGGGSGDESGQKVTKTGLVIGTPEFMSPEQISGDKLDGRSDLYSLALVLYRMLTGKLPFEATTAQEAMIKRLTDDPRTLAVARPDLTFPPGLQPVLDTALARSPVDRYHSVAKFAADVASVTGLGRGASSGLPRTSADAQAKTQLLDAPAAPRRASTPPALPVRKRSRVPVAVGVVALLGLGGAGVVVLGGGGDGGDGGDGGPASGADSAAVPQNTAAAPTNPQTGDSGRQTSGGQPGRPTGTPRTGIDPARAGAALFALSGDVLDERISPRAARDSAMKFYYSKLSDSLRAVAAHIVLNAYLTEGSRVQALDWALKARQLAPNDTTIAQIVRQLRNEP